MIRLTPLKKAMVCSTLKNTQKSNTNFAAVQAAKNDDTVSGVVHLVDWILKAARHRNQIALVESAVSSFLHLLKQTILNPITGVL